MEFIDIIIDVEKKSKKGIVTFM